MVGKILVQDVTEHTDGSATVVFDCDSETRELLVGLGLASLLEKATNKEEGYDVPDPNQLELDLWGRDKEFTNREES